MYVGFLNTFSGQTLKLLVFFRLQSCFLKVNRFQLDTWT